MEDKEKPNNKNSIIYLSAIRDMGLRKCCNSGELECKVKVDEIRSLRAIRFFASPVEWVNRIGEWLGKEYHLAIFHCGQGCVLDQVRGAVIGANIYGKDEVIPVRDGDWLIDYNGSIRCVPDSVIQFCIELCDVAFHDYIDDTGGF